MHRQKPTLSFWQIWNMCFGFLGIQFGFALQNANVSRIFQSLGLARDCAREADSLGRPHWPIRAGVGLAIANTMDLSAIVATISAVRMPGADTPTNASAPGSTAARLPETLSRLVISAISACP